MTTAMNMSPRTATAGDDEAEKREVGAHAPDVNREQRRNERTVQLRSIGRARPLLGLDLGGDRAWPRARRRGPSSLSTVSSASVGR